MSGSQQTFEARERSGRTACVRGGSLAPARPAAQFLPQVSEAPGAPAPASGMPAVFSSGGILPPGPATFAPEKEGNSFVEWRCGAGPSGGERRASDAQAVAGALQSRGRAVLRVYGASMLPWVRPGDIAVIYSASPDTVRCGDVVLFRRGDRLYVHRIVEKRGLRRGARFLAKGDANPHADGMIGQEEILGRVVNLYRGERLIDLDSPGQLAFGLLVSQCSRSSGLGYALARFATAVAGPARRMVRAVLSSGAPVR